MKLYAVNLWVKFITEGTYIEYYPINRTLIEKFNANVPLKEEEDMHLTLLATLCKNINKTRAQG